MPSARLGLTGTMAGMSLTPAQRAQTAAELARNASLSGLGLEQIAHQCDWSISRTSEALAVDGANPADVWRVRDLLESAVRASGQQPVAYSVLTESMRSAARGWFRISGPGSR